MRYDTSDSHKRDRPGQQERYPDRASEPPPGKMHFRLDFLPIWICCHWLFPYAIRVPELDSPWVFAWNV